MNRKILLTPIMAISLITSCNNGGNNEVSLTTRVKYCTVTGQKEKYNKGDKVSLTFTPYPYFSLPSKEDLFIGGVNDFDYSNTTGVLSFNITTRTAIMVECASSFGRIATYQEAHNWVKIRNEDHLTINSLTYDYAFTDIGEETDEGKIVLRIINNIIKIDGQEKPFTTLKEKNTINAPEANKYSISHPAERFSSKDEETIYLMKLSSDETPQDDDELLISSSNVKLVKADIKGVSGFTHYFSKAGDIDELNFIFKDTIIKDELGTLEPINGYIKISATYNITK